MRHAFVDEAGDPVLFNAKGRVIVGEEGCFERRERRFLDLLWPKVGLILDRDDTESRGTGEYYHRKEPIPPDFRQDDAAGTTDGGA